MKCSNLEINDVFLLEPIKHSDERGYFMESYNQRTFNEKVGGKIEFVQDNISFSKIMKIFFLRVLINKVRMAVSSPSLMIYVQG